MGVLGVARKVCEMLGEQSIKTEAFQIAILEPNRDNVGRLEGFVGKADRSDGQL